MKKIHLSNDDANSEGLGTLLILLQISPSFPKAT